MGKKHFTISEAAKHLGITRQSVHIAIKKGRLPATITSRTVKLYLIAKKDLDAYRVDHNRQSSGKKQ